MSRDNDDVIEMKLRRSSPRSDPNQNSSDESESLLRHPEQLYQESQRPRGGKCRNFFSNLMGSPENWKIARVLASATTSAFSMLSYYHDEAAEQKAKDKFNDYLESQKNNLITGFQELQRECYVDQDALASGYIQISDHLSKGLGGVRESLYQLQSQPSFDYNLTTSYLDDISDGVSDLCSYLNVSNFTDIIQGNATACQKLINNTVSSLELMPQELFEATSNYQEEFENKLSNPYLHTLAMAIVFTSTVAVIAMSTKKNKDDKHLKSLREDIKDDDLYGSFSKRVGKLISNLKNKPNQDAISDIYGGDLKAVYDKAKDPDEELSTGESIQLLTPLLNILEENHGIVFKDGDNTEEENKESLNEMEGRLLKLNTCPLILSESRLYQRKNLSTYHSIAQGLSMSIPVVYAMSKVFGSGNDVISAIGVSNIGVVLSTMADIWAERELGAERVAITAGQKAEKKGLRDDLKRSQSKIKTKEVELLGVNGQLEDERKENAQQEQQIRGLIGQVELLEDQKKHSVESNLIDRIEEIENKEVEIAERLKVNKAELATNVAEISRRELQNTGLQAEKGSKEGKIEAIEKDAKTKRVELEKVDKKITELKGEIESKKNEVRIKIDGEEGKEEENKEGLKGEKERLEQELEDDKVEESQILSKIEEKENESNVLEEKESTRQRDFKEKIAELEAKAEELSSIISLHDEIKNKLDKISETLGDEENPRDGVEVVKLMALMSEREELQERESQILGEYNNIEGVRSEYKDINANKSSLTEQEQEAKKQKVGELQELSATIKGLQESLGSKQGEISRKEERITKIPEEIESIKEEGQIYISQKEQELEESRQQKQQIEGKLSENYHKESEEKSSDVSQEPFTTEKEGSPIKRSRDRIIQIQADRADNELAIASLIKRNEVITDKNEELETNQEKFKEQREKIQKEQKRIQELLKQENRQYDQEIQDISKETPSPIISPTNELQQLITVSSKEKQGHEDEHKTQGR